MEEYRVKITAVKKITRDVLNIFTEKPEAYSFVPGQATDVSVNKDGWRDETRPFTFTCLPERHYLEFCTKTYPERKGVTNQLLQLKINDELIIRDAFGTISFKGEGVFIAGGAGVTPFVCILRFLHSKNLIANNKLIFANKTHDDIILEEELSAMLGGNFISILSEERREGYVHGLITEHFLAQHVDDFSKHFYLCGPPPMMHAVESHLAHLGVTADQIVSEEF